MAPKQPAQTAWVVLPTYNEAGSIKELLDRLLAATAQSRWQVVVLVVDDLSPDGTADLVIPYTQMPQSRVQLLSNPQKNGIGYAYSIGYQTALKAGADVVVEMDADLQHPPEQVPELLAEIDYGYDFVIGSRKRAGGENNLARRGLWRYLLTALGGWLIRFILLWPGKYYSVITDPTSGFRATTREYALRLDFSHLVSWGFPYKYDTLYQVVRMGTCVSEIPLKFKQRTQGVSKMGRGAIKEALLSVLKLRLS